jgi:hypothetical protein
VVCSKAVAKWLLLRPGSLSQRTQPNVFVLARFSVIEHTVQLELCQPASSHVVDNRHCARNPGSVVQMLFRTANRWPAYKSAQPKCRLEDSPTRVCLRCTQGP